MASKEYAIELSAQADLDYSKIYAQIASSDRMPASKKEYIDAIDQEIEQLKRSPNGHRVYFKNTRHGDLRGVTVKDYTILYVVDDNSRRVTIVRIPYASSDIEGMLNKGLV